MDPMTLAAIMGGVQMLSGAQKEKSDKQLAAATQRYSPWTGNKAGPIRYADPAGTAMQAVGTGMAGQQAVANQAANQKLLDAQTGFFNRVAGGDGMGGGIGMGGSAPGWSVGAGVPGSNFASMPNPWLYGGN